MKMDFYGDSRFGSPMLLINPTDKGRVITKNWEGAPIYTDKQEAGKVSFARGILDASICDIEVDKEDPTLLHIRFTCHSVRIESTAEISQDGLIFKYFLRAAELNGHLIS